MEMDYKLTRTKRKSCARTRALPVLTHLRHRRANFAVTHNTLTGEKLLAGEIDVAFILASSDSPAVRQLLDDERILLAGYPRADAMVALYPFLHRVVIPRGAGNFAKDRPPTDVVLVATKASLVVRKELHPAIQYLLLN